MRTKLRDNYIPCIESYDSLDVSTDDEGIMITRFDSLNGKSKMDLIIMSKEEAHKLAELIRDTYKD